MTGLFQVPNRTICVQMYESCTSDCGELVIALLCPAENGCCDFLFKPLPCIGTSHKLRCGCVPKRLSEHSVPSWCASQNWYACTGVLQDCGSTTCQLEYASHTAVHLNLVQVPAWYLFTFMLIGSLVMMCGDFQKARLQPFT